MTEKGHVFSSAEAVKQGLATRIEKLKISSRSKMLIV